jgi:hypothetical protein
MANYPLKQDPSEKLLDRTLHESYAHKIARVKIADRIKNCSWFTQRWSLETCATGLFLRQKDSPADFRLLIASGPRIDAAK